jgi:pyruvate,water dikinase
MEYFRTIPAPPALGTPASGPPPTDPLNVAIGKFLGAPPQAAEKPDVVRGSAGSPGRVTGPAKVIRSLAEASKLRPGDVLVAETTAPPWTPLFATAAAIVTDTGGVLSHCAIVAREYGIPAVVGTGMATSRIVDGQIVEVDGDAGLVRLR